jgi:ferredoxin
MAITRVWIEEGCIACGASEANCPEVFNVDYDEGTARVIEGIDFSPHEEAIKQAAEECPVDTIQFEEE